MGEGKECLDVGKIREYLRRRESGGKESNVKGKTFSLVGFCHFIRKDLEFMLELFKA